MPTKRQKEVGSLPPAAPRPPDGEHQRIYACSFDKIGRTHAPPMLVVNASTAEQIAEQVYRYSRKFLGSKEVEAWVDLEEMRGGIAVGGFRPVGSFTIEDRGEFIQ